MNDPNQVAPRWSVSTMRRAAAEDDLAASALRYANLGFPVFPCVPGGKPPLTANGFHDATSSARVVHDWWRRTPNANIGLPTGSDAGVLVVDIDIHSGESGFEAFERARGQGLADKWGWLVRTPSGGLHAYYPTTGEQQRCWQSPNSHIDFRGDGGYVIAPPSRVEVAGWTTSYEVIAVANHAPAPLDAARLKRFLDPPRPLPRPRSPQPQVERRPERLADWVASLPEGGRNGGLFWAACRVVEEGHPYEVAMATVGAGGRRAGLPEREVESTIHSAYRITSRLSLDSRLGPTRRSEVIGL